tara:strand:+ start:292 stop:3147 length:2856 start_codon:yes stop_codon:yes gene_type:complete
MALSYGHSFIGNSYHLIYKLTLKDETSRFYLTKSDADDAFHNYRFFSQVTESTTELGKWVNTFFDTPTLAHWDTSIHNQTDNVTSLYVIVDHRNATNEVGWFYVDEKFIPVVEKHPACCYEKGYPCIDGDCSCRTAYNNGLLVIKKATPYTMQQVKTYDFDKIYLGSYEGLDTKHAIERIVTFSGKNNKEKSGLQYYQVGGSTFTVATIDPSLKVKNQLKTALPSLEKFVCVVYGNFYSWSHLPCLKINVRFDGIYELNPTTQEMKNEKSRFEKKWFGSAFSTLQTVTSQTLVVFQLVYLSEVTNTKKLLKYEKELTDLTSKPNWVGSMKRKTKEPIYVGRILLGFFYKDMLQTWNKVHLQNTLIQLAAYGIKNEYGIDKLKNLNNTLLRNLLSKLPQKYKKLKQTMIHRILNAARYQRKSPKWLLVHVFFPASYGQYLRDNEEILNDLHRSLNNTEEEKMDMILYNSDFAFQYPPYAVQVGATIATWQKRFSSRMVGSDERFIVWKLFKDRRCTQGHMLHPNNLEVLLKESGASSNGEVNITEEIFQSNVAQLMDHDVLKQVVDANGNSMLCFNNDYDMFYLFIHCVKQLNTSISIGTACKDDSCLVYPTEHVLNHFHSICPTSKQMDTVSVEAIAKETFYIQTLETNHQKLYLDSNKPLILIGLENWSFDTIVYVLNSLQKQEKSVTMHFFGYDALPKITTPRRRFLPLMEDLLHELPTSTKRVDNAVDELMIKTNEEFQTFLRNEDILNYVIVVHTKKELEAVKQMQLGLPSEDKFKIGDTVITPSGFVSTIRRLFYYSKDISSWGMEKHLYLGTEIELKNDTKMYRANKLKHAFVILSNQLVTPLQKVILYGAVPNYTKELFESGFATERLVYLQYESLDDKISKQFNATIELHADRTTPFSSCLKEFTQKKKAVEERRQVELDATRKRKLSQLFAQQRKKHKEYGK